MFIPKRELYKSVHIFEQKKNTYKILNKLIHELYNLNKLHNNSQHFQNINSQNLYIIQRKICAFKARIKI